MTRLLALIPLALTGCALDVTETASMDELSRMTNKRSLERQFVEFETVAETREEVAKGIIRRGRAFYDDHPRSEYKNLVVTMLGDTCADSHLDGSIRAKAVWVIGEAAVFAGPLHARKEAKVQIDRACGEGYVRVGEEVARSLNKLGFGTPEGEDAQGPELRRDGYTTVDSYDPRERGHMEEVVP